MYYHRIQAHTEDPGDFSRLLSVLQPRMLIRFKEPEMSGYIEFEDDDGELYQGLYEVYSYPPWESVFYIFTLKEKTPKLDCRVQKGLKEWVKVKTVRVEI